MVVLATQWGMLAVQLQIVHVWCVLPRNHRIGVLNSKAINVVAELYVESVRNGNTKVRRKDATAETARTCWKLEKATAIIDDISWRLYAGLGIDSRLLVWLIFARFGRLVQALVDRATKSISVRTIKARDVYLRGVRHAHDKVGASWSFWLRLYVVEIL
jgi:hypothetical protein